MPDELELLRARVRVLEDAAGHALCAFCGARVPKEPAAVASHVLSCSKHPVSRLVAENAELTARLVAAYDRVAAQSDALSRRAESRPPEHASAALLDELVSDMERAFSTAWCDSGAFDEAGWLRGWFNRNRVLLGRLPPPLNPPPSALDPLTLPPPGDKSAQPEVVCLCGSTRFKQQFIEANFRLTMLGKIVLTVGWFSHADGHVYTPTPEEKAKFDELHLRKIDLCHVVFVVNVGGYVGNSTRREVAYALAHGKRVEYLEPPQ